MTDNAQELDKAIRIIFNVNHQGTLYYNHDIDDILDYQDVYDAKKAILDWHNKQTLELLDRLDKSMPTDEQLTTKYGYHMPDKQYGYSLGLHDIREVIEAERKKLNGM